MPLEGLESGLTGLRALRVLVLILGFRVPGLGFKLFFLYLGFRVSRILGFLYFGFRI